MKTTSLITRFGPDKVISGEWIISGFRQCMDPGNFYFTRIRIIDGIEGHPDKVFAEPLDLWYRSDEGDEIRVWRMPDSEIWKERTKEQDAALSNEKEEKVYELIRSCEPPHGLPLEKELSSFISVFTGNCEMFMNERSVLDGMIKGDNCAASTIKSKYGIDSEELRQMTRMAFQDRQPRNRGTPNCREGFVRIDYNLSSN